MIGVQRAAQQGAGYPAEQQAPGDHGGADRPRMRSGRRWRWVGSVLVAGLLLTACDAPRPDVTFFGNRAAVQTGPTRWCDVDEAAMTVTCATAGVQDVSKLSLRPGQHVQINVPGSVGSTPWAVYFRYLDAKGKLSDGRSEVFTDGQLAYTLQTLAPEDQLTYVEVQSGFVLVPGEQGGVDFAATRGWLLLIDPLPSAQANQQ